MNFKVNAQGFVESLDDPPVWIPPLNLKQFEAFNDYHRYLLVDGPRKSSKTWGICHKVIRHCFDIDGAVFAILNKTMKLAKSSGVWSLLTGRMMPMWERECSGFKIVEGPKVSGDTKLSFVKIRNRHGTISELQCHSLEHAAEVEGKFKSSVYSGFWCSEADQYLTEHAFHILCDAMRMSPFVPYDMHQFIMDMNPPDSGENNWFHDMFFKQLAKPLEETEDPIFTQGLHRIGFSLDDNPQLDPNERRELIARYRKRPTLYSRFIEGRWVQDITDGHFSESYDEGVHVIGTDSGSEEEREVATPTDGCRILLTGWDMGERNHSFHILEKIFTDFMVKNERTGRDEIHERVSFSILDELVVINKYVSIQNFAEAAVEKIDFWEAWIKKTYNRTVKWRHWSDTTAFQLRATAETTEAAIVFDASGKRVSLDAAPKGRGSQRARVKLFCHLFDEERLHLSAQLKATRIMFANLRKGSSDAEFIREDEHKHPFDSVSYPVIAEAPMDMLRSAEVESKRGVRSPGLVMASI